MTVPALFYPVSRLAGRIIKDSFNRVYIPGTTKKYARGRHGGIDIAGPKGTVLDACFWGRIHFPNWGSALGIHFLIINSQGVGALYCHLAYTPLKDGDIVQAKQYVGRMGDSGQTTGAHLHFEIHPRAKVWTSIENPYVQLERARQKLLAA